MIKNKLDIAIIDDHLLFAEGIEQHLAGLTRHVNTTLFTEGSKFLRWLETKDGLDMIVLDLNMPDISGLELLHALKNKSVDVPVLVVSASFDTKEITDCLSAGAMGFVSKSSASDKMIDACKSVLAKERYLDSSVLIHDLDLGAEAQSGSGIQIPPRTFEVLQLVGEGHSNKVIGDILSITESTVKWHVAQLFKMLNAKNRTTCLAKAAKAGLINI